MHPVLETANVALAERTTLRLGGPATRVIEAGSTAEIIEAVRRTDAAAEPLLLLGDGSNLVVADAGFDGTVVALNSRGIDVRSDPEGGGVVIRARAGEPWDALVSRAVESGWSGIEALSGIPGRVGATPVQNVGAYGQEVSQTITAVRAWERLAAREVTLPSAECRFGYRTSRFKADPSRHVVVSVTFRLRRDRLGSPVSYAELARTLGVQLGRRAPAAEVREAVLALRRAKGMVLDDDDHDTWSAGSFFTNPIVDAATAGRLPDAAPRWPHGDGRVKVGAAWLIEHAGFERGHRRGGAAVSSKHTLALTNRGTASTDDLLTLAREIRDAVAARFAIALVNEPTLVGCGL